MTLDEIFATIKSYKTKPKLSQVKTIEDLVRNLGFKQGKLYMANQPLVWIYGDVTNPEWMGSRGLDKSSFIMTSSPGDAFFFIEHVLLHWFDELEKRKYWLFWLKFIVNDRIAYFPIPDKIIDDELENEFKDLFREAN